jgi:predicted deacetylase
MKGLLVSIHDVTPALERGVRAAWEMCRREGVTPALLVVPDWHGAWPIERHESFVDWLRECADLGAEILLHGERHDEDGLRRGYGDALRAWGRTAREGEFLTLGVDAARERITRGVLRLSSLGLAPIGFVPPAWLARSATFRAARECGLAVAEDSKVIHLLRDGVQLPSPVVRWSACTAWRARASGLVARARRVVNRRDRLMRVAIHPPDLGDLLVAESVERALAFWARARRRLGYAGLAAAAGREAPLKAASSLFAGRLIR